MPFIEKIVDFYKTDPLTNQAMLDYIAVEDDVLLVKKERAEFFQEQFDINLTEGRFALGREDGASALDRVCRRAVEAGHLRYRIANRLFPFLDVVGVVVHADCRALVYCGLLDQVSVQVLQESSGFGLREVLNLQQGDTLLNGQPPDEERHNEQ